MVVDNERLVELYNETEEKRNKEILYKQISLNVKKEAMKICHFYNKALLLACNRDYFDEFEQEAEVCLVRCIERYNKNKGASFSTFFYRCLKNHISNVFTDKFNVVSNEMSNTSMLSWQKDNKTNDMEQEVDNKLLYEILAKNVNSLCYSRPLHETLFKEYIGFSNPINHFANFKTLSEKYGLTRMGVKKICDKYLGLLKKQLADNGDLETVQVFL